MSSPRWAIALALLLWASLHSPDVGGPCLVGAAMVNPRHFKYYVHRNEYILVRFDESAPFSSRDFQVCVDSIAALAYLGYTTIILPPSPDSYANANNAICTTKSCFIEKSKENHIELLPKDFEVVAPTTAGSFLRIFNSSITFGTQGIPQLAPGGIDFTAYACLHPCRVHVPLGMSSAEAIRRAGSFSLIVVLSDHSKDKYLYDLRDHAAAAGALGFSLPQIKPIRQPIPESLLFPAGSLKFQRREDGFRVLVGTVQVTARWQQVLSRVVGIYSKTCDKMYGNITCELVFLCDLAAGVDFAVRSRLLSVSEMMHLNLSFVGNLTEQQAHEEIRRSHLYVALSDAPEVLGLIESGRPLEHQPTLLIDYLALCAFLYDVPALHLSYGAALELMPTAMHRGRSMLVFDSIEQLQRSSEFIIRKLSDRERKERFMKNARKFVRGLEVRTVVSVLGKLMQKFPHVAVYNSFVRNNIATLRGFKLSAHPAGRNVAVCVEPSLHPTVEFAVRNVLLHLPPSWAMCVFHSDANERFMKNILRDVPGITFIRIGDNFTTRNSYSKWMKSPVLWQELLGRGYQHALHFQSDALMLRGDIEQYLQYDYIGAPWCYDANSKNETASGIGNGGFSLRNISAMLAISQQAQETSEIEDVFFVSRMEKEPERYALPSRLTAYNFAREVICTNEFSTEVSVLQSVPDGAGPQISSLPNAVPLGLHAAWLFAHLVGRTDEVFGWLHAYYAAFAERNQ